MVNMFPPRVSHEATFCAWYLDLSNNWLGSKQVKFSKGTATQFFYEYVHVMQLEISNSYQQDTLPPATVKTGRGQGSRILRNAVSDISKSFFV